LTSISESPPPVCPELVEENIERGARLITIPIIYSDDSGRSCNIINIIMAPIIKSRETVLTDGSRSSRKYIVLAPRLEITTPPKIIAGSKRRDDILGAIKEIKMTGIRDLQYAKRSLL